ncbi:glycosyltransferase [Salinibacter ruber]|uniref:glycosyltransferase n=1 Tax=Salinibacter ruber TaxID=146919 RepID=UPI000E6C192B|nr:glycosyltransferase [Salinibacter ruber]
MSKEEISVVVCAYNEERLLEDCLQSLINQNYPADAYEIIIVDDASTDRTPDIAKSFVQSIDSEDAHIRYVRIEDGGLSRARNAGIRASRHDVIAFIDGDAVAESDWLERLAAVFEEGADYVGGRIELLNTDSKVAQFAQATRHRQLFGPDVYRNEIIGCNMAYRRKVFDAVGGFNDNLTSRGDEVSLRKRIPDDFRFQSAPQAVVYHERPERLIEWIDVEWKAAVLSGLYRDASTFRRFILKYGFSLERILFALLPVFGALFTAGSSIGGIATALGSVSGLRRTFGNLGALRTWRGLMRKYGYVQGTTLHVLYYYARSVVQGFGTLSGAWKHRNNDLLPANADPAAILEAQSNLPEEEHTAKMSP